MWLDKFCRPGKADVLVGGQWGSEGKGAAAAYLAARLIDAGRFYKICTTNAGAQAGHTSVHNSRKRVVFHLPTAAVVAHDNGVCPMVYLNGGSIIDPTSFEQELKDNKVLSLQCSIHPNAAVITPECRAAELDPLSPQSKIASTRKGVGEALAQKVRRAGNVAIRSSLTKYTRRLDLNDYLGRKESVLVEVPQGIGLSIDGPFYPYCTSRNCTLQQGLADAGIHPHFMGSSILVLRTTPIRVGNVKEGTSGGCYPDQKEISWEELGVPPEITTVTKRVRRVFTFSALQAREAMALTRPDVIYLTFCDYPVDVDDIVRQIYKIADDLGLSPSLLQQYGPTTDDVKENGAATARLK